MNNITTSIKNNLPSILAFGAAIGVVATGVLAARAHVKATDILKEAEFPEESEPKERVVEAVKLTWKTYAPAVVVGGATIGLIFGSNGSHLKKEAALVGVISIVGSRLKNMDLEVLKKYGQEEFEEIQKRIIDSEIKDQKDRIEAMSKHQHPTDSDEGVFYEPSTDDLFWASTDQIDIVETRLNAMIQQDGYATFADYLRLLPTKTHDIPEWSHHIGWYVGDDYFEEAAAFSGYLIRIVQIPETREGCHDAIAIRPSIAPMPPSPDWMEAIRGNMPFHTNYKIEPGDQLELPFN